MSAALATALAGLIRSILVAAISYWLSKQRGREAEWRKEKLAYYKAFVESLSGIIEGEDTPDGHRLYARTTNNLLPFAPRYVIDALNSFRIETSKSGSSNRTQEKRDKLSAKLLIAIRQDVGIHPSDDPLSFKPILWAAGVGKSNVNQVMA